MTIACTKSTLPASELGRRLLREALETARRRARSPCRPTESVQRGAASAAAKNHGDPRCMLLIGDELQVLAALAVGDERQFAQAMPFDAIYLDSPERAARHRMQRALLPALTLERNARRIAIPSSARAESPEQSAARHEAALALASRLLTPAGQLCIDAETTSGASRSSVASAVWVRDAAPRTGLRHCVQSPVASHEDASGASSPGGPPSTGPQRKILDLTGDSRFAIEQDAERGCWISGAAPGAAAARARRRLLHDGVADFDIALAGERPPDASAPRLLLAPVWLPGDGSHMLLRVVLLGLEWPGLPQCHGLARLAADRLHRYAQEEPLALLDDWALDIDFGKDGVYRPAWSCRRGAKWIVPLETAIEVPRGCTVLRLCVRAHDVFGRRYERRLRSRQPARLRP